MVRSGARLSGGVSCDCHAVSHARSLSRRTASSSRSQVRASSPCCVGRLTLAQPSASVHRHTLAAGGIVTQLVTRPHPKPLLYFRAAQPCPDPLLAKSLARPGLIRFVGPPESADIRARWCQPWVSSDEADVRRRLMLWWTAPEIALASMTVGARRDWGRHARWCARTLPLVVI